MVHKKHKIYKDKGVAYVLSILGSELGLPWFYMEKVAIAFFNVLLCLFIYLLAFSSSRSGSYVAIGVFHLFWVIINMILVNKMVDEHNAEVYSQEVNRNNNDSSTVSSHNAEVYSQEVNRNNNDVVSTEDSNNNINANVEDNAKSDTMEVDDNTSGSMGWGFVIFATLLAFFFMLIISKS